MQAPTRYFDRRGYIEFILLMIVALAAAGVGRWVIPGSGSQQGPSAVSESSAATSSLQAHIADLKQSLLDSQAAAGGFTSPLGVPFNESHAERFALMQAAQMEAQDAAAGLAPVSSSIVPGLSQAERFAAFKQSQLDAQDNAAGTSSQPAVPSNSAGQTLAARLAEMKQNQLDALDASR
jgi:hypothetical protein